MNDQKDVIRTNAYGQTIEIITKYLDSDSALYRPIIFQEYSGRVHISYTITSSSDLDGLKIYFADSETTFDTFFDYDTQVSDYPDCQKQNESVASGSCTIQNGGGIIFYNTAKTEKKIKITLTITPNNLLIADELGPNY